MPDFCRHQAIGMNREGGVRYGCGLRATAEGRYRKISPMAGSYDINGTKGCKRFMPSGMPAHPSIIDTLVGNNIRAKAIPIDKKEATTGKAFIREMLEYPHVECYFDLKKKFSRAVE